jgi:hypothetical protein
MRAKRPSTFLNLTVAGSGVIRPKAEMPYALGKEEQDNEKVNRLGADYGFPCQPCAYPGSTRPGGNIRQPQQACFAGWDKRQPKNFRFGWEG